MHFPLSEANQNLQAAIITGDEAAVRHWLPRSDPKDNHSIALQNAALYGDEAIIRLLLPHCDPRALESMALRWAADCGHEASAALLAPVSDTLAVWRLFKTNQTWKALDCLSRHVPDVEMQAVFKLAPPGAMPLTQALLLDQTLSTPLATTPKRSRF